MRILCIAFLLQSIVYSNPYKILVYSASYAQSINNFIGNIADTLVEAGHNVTYLIPIVNPDLRVTSHKAKIIFVQPTEEVKKITEEMSKDYLDPFVWNEFNPMTTFPIGISFSHWFNSQCKTVLDEPGLVDKLKEEKYDVMIVESVETCGIALSHLIKIKSLITSGGSIPLHWQTDEFGMETALSYNPNPIMSRLDVHSFWSRLMNLYADTIFKLTWLPTRTEINQIFRDRYGDGFPKVQEIASHAAFSYINSEPLIDFAVPTLSRVIYIGGVGAKAPKKLDKELDKILSLRNKTVLISFGSFVLSNKLPMNMRENIVQTTSRFPDVTFIWKYEDLDDDFANEALSSTLNLHMLNWTPQNDLLAHERLTAFITHGGMASSQEIALRGKPGLFIPFFFDQPRNAAMMERNGFGKVFSKYDLSDAVKLYEAVKDLLENEKYRQNAARISEMIRKKPFSARDLLVKSVEFAAEFGPSQALRPAIFDMNWIEYHNIDIIAVLFFTMIIISVLLIRLSVMCLKRFERLFKIKVD